MPENMKSHYLAMISTDWNECMSPMGPFDPIVFTYPELKPGLTKIFRDYTSNKISLSRAVHRLRELMPGPLSSHQMDAYLDRHFVTYRGVPELIRWCEENSVLFMVNTTASIGFFQRVLAKGLLPPIPALSAHPGIRYEPLGTDPVKIHELLEITDKPVNTRIVAQACKIPFSRIMIIGDSGGDGPHFQWGAEAGAFLAGSMTKQSLDAYCKRKGIKIDLYFGLKYGKDERRDEKREMATDFRKLEETIRKLMDR